MKWVAAFVLGALFLPTCFAQGAKPNVSVREFVFITKSVELEGVAAEPHRYRVEGVTINGLRILIDCADTPPPDFLHVVSSEELLRQDNEHRDVDTFRKIVLERVGWASLNAKKDRMVLYANVPDMEDAIRARKPTKEPFANCPIVNSIENGADMFPVTILSSQFRAYKNGGGYEVEAETADELLTLGCAEIKGAACMSLPPNTYRATRSGSEVRLYDADLRLIGDYRVLSETALSHPH